MCYGRLIPTENTNESANEVTGGWRKLYKEELHNLYSLPIIIGMIKSRRMRWAGHVTRMGKEEFI
jgi:hypothetical protein